MLGGMISIYDITVSVRTDDEGLSVALHPTFLCWIDTHALFHGTCYGNVMVCNSKLPSEIHKKRIVAHEARHLEQWCALGVWTWVAGFAMPLEPEFTDWSDPSVELAQMWSPPAEWVDQWEFVAITVPRS